MKSLNCCSLLYMWLLTMSKCAMHCCCYCCCWDHRAFAIPLPLFITQTHTQVLSLMFMQQILSVLVLCALAGIRNIQHTYIVSAISTYNLNHTIQISCTIYMGTSLVYGIWLDIVYCIVLCCIITYYSTRVVYKYQYESGSSEVIIQPNTLKHFVGAIVTL